VKDQHLSHLTTRTWYSEGIILPFSWTCYVSVLTELVSLQTSQADVSKVTSLVYEPGATKLSFFLQQWPQEGAFSLTGCKMWSANP
jgi:hypothetical protein